MRTPANLAASLRDRIVQGTHRRRVADLAGQAWSRVFTKI